MRRLTFGCSNGLGRSATLYGNSGPSARSGPRALKTCKIIKFWHDKIIILHEYFEKIIQTLDKIFENTQTNIRMSFVRMPFLVSKLFGHFFVNL